MEIAPQQMALQYRYDLYCRAHDAFEESPSADVSSLRALARHCKRTLEMIEMARLLVENRYPMLAIEHIGAHHATCADCVRKTCLTVDEIEPLQQLRRLIA